VGLSFICATPQASCLFELKSLPSDGGCGIARFGGGLTFAGRLGRFARRTVGAVLMNCYALDQVVGSAVSRRRWRIGRPLVGVRFEVWLRRGARPLRRDLSATAVVGRRSGRLGRH
jgi:hypothetical protein